MGYATAGHCYATVADAASAACSAVSGTASTGQVSCTGIVSTAANGAVLQLRFIQSSTSTAMQQSLTFQPCTLYDWSYWAPITSMWIVAAVAILCAYKLVDLFAMREL